MAARRCGCLPARVRLVPDSARVLHSRHQRSRRDAFRAEGLPANEDELLPREPGAVGPDDGPALDTAVPPLPGHLRLQGVHHVRGLLPLRGGLHHGAHPGGHAGALRRRHVPDALLPHGHQAARVLRHRPRVGLLAALLVHPAHVVGPRAPQPHERARKGEIRNALPNHRPPSLLHRPAVRHAFLFHTDVHRHPPAGEEHSEAGGVGRRSSEPLDRYRQARARHLRLHARHLRRLLALLVHHALPGATRKERDHSREAGGRSRLLPIRHESFQPTAVHVLEARFPTRSGFRVSGFPEDTHLAATAGIERAPNDPDDGNKRENPSVVEQRRLRVENERFERQQWNNAR